MARQKLFLGKPVLDIEPITSKERLIDCTPTYVAVTTRDVRGMTGVPPIPRGYVAPGFLGTKAVVKQQIADAFANKAWPKRSLRVLGVLDCRRPTKVPGT